MVKLDKSEVLGRKIRKGPSNEVGISAWTKIKEAIKGGRAKEAFDLVDYLSTKGKAVHDIYCDWVYHMMSIISNKWFAYSEVDL